MDKWLKYLYMYIIVKDSNQYENSIAIVVCSLTVVGVSLILYSSNYQCRSKSVNILPYDLVLKKNVCS